MTAPRQAQLPLLLSISEGLSRGTDEMLRVSPQGDAMHPPSCSLAIREAVEEIEWLRAENEHLHRAHQTACEGGDLLRVEIERLRAFEAAHKQLQAALDIAIRERDEARAEVAKQISHGDLLYDQIEHRTSERDEALEEVRCLGLSEALAAHSGSPSREWHSVGAWLYPGETINHVIRSPRELVEDKP